MGNKIIHTWNSSLFKWTKSDFFESLQYSLPEDNSKYIKNSFSFELPESISIDRILKYYKIDNFNWTTTYIFPWKYWFIIEWDDCFIDHLSENDSIDFSKYEDLEQLVLSNLIKFGCIVLKEDVKIDTWSSANWLFKKKTLFYLSLTNRCNLWCPFCVANANSSTVIDSTSDMLKIIDNIEDYLASVKDDWVIYKIWITWWEPFIRTDILEILERIKTHDNVEYNITTNWTLLNAKHLEIIKKNNINLIFSLDGATSDEHDKFRWAWNFDKTISTINKVNSYWIPFFVNSFLYEWNVNSVKDRIILFDSLWCRWINFLNSFWRWRDSNFFYKEADEDILFDTIYNYLIAYPWKEYLFNNISLFYSIFLRVLSWAKLNHSWSWFAEPMMVWSDWEVYITPSLYKNKDYYMWNLLDESLANILKNENIHVKEVRARDIDNIESDDEDFNAMKYFFWWENISENVIFWKKLHPSYTNRIKTIKKVFRILSENPDFWEKLLSSK